MPLAVGPNPVHSANYSEFHVVGSFNVGAAGAVGALFGRGFTVALQTDPGTYRVTVLEGYNGVLISTRANINRVAAGDAGFAAFCGHALYATARQIDIFVRDAADAAVNPANGTNVSFDFAMLTSTA